MCSCCRPWRSHLHFGYHRCRPCRPVMYTCASAPRSGAVFIECSHTLSASSSIAFPLSSSYLFSMSLTFCTSVPIIVCIDLSMPSVSSLLSLPGLALAPPLKRLVRHCLWPVDVTTKLAQKNKKDRKVSAYLTSSSKKEHKQTRIT